MSYPRQIEARYTLSNVYDVPSIREDVENRMVAELAMQAHRGGGQFAAWPKFETIGESHFDSQRIEAKVWVIPR